MPARDIVDPVMGNEKVSGQEPPSAGTVRHADRDHGPVLVTITRKKMAMQLRREGGRQA
jgi:hypothetical protein